MIKYSHKKSWTGNAQRWATYLPPFRPSKGELKVIEKYLKKIKKNRSNWQAKALILGATPEYRDILARLKFSVTMVDFSPDSVGAMTLLCKYRGAKREKLIISNWLTMNFKPNTFDVILGDWSFENLPSFKRDYPKLFSVLNKILKSDGLFIHRTNVWSKKEKIRSVREIMKMYEKNPKEKFSFLQMLQDYSTASVRNPKDFTVDLEKFYHGTLVRAYAKGEMNDQQFDEFVWKFVQGKWRIKLFLTIPEKSKLEGLLRKYFKIIAREYGKDYLYSRHLPIYILKKK